MKPIRKVLTSPHLTSPVYISWHLRCCPVWWTVKVVRAQRYSTQASGTPHIGACYDSNIILQYICAIYLGSGVCWEFAAFLCSFSHESRAIREKQKWMFRRFSDHNCHCFSCSWTEWELNSVQNKHYSAIYLEWFLPLISKGIINM